MGELKSELMLVINNELLRLLALNRADEITPAQLQRLDFLLAQRGREIDEHIALLHCIDKHAA